MTAGAAKDLVTAVGVGGCWGNWLLPWIWVGVGEFGKKKNIVFLIIF